LNADDAKTLLVHEVLHTRSAAFANNIAQTFGVPRPDGTLPSFSDGSPVRGITEGLTDNFTKQALNVDSTPADYSRESKWANRLIDKVGIETVKTAYFANDVAAMVKVKKAINELVLEDKKAPESPAARSPSPGSGRTV
jgi:hypothetical protein